jgi:UDPglucose 6-dehydrogenase
MLIWLERVLVVMIELEKDFYFPIGYGGSCFPKDVQALIKSSEEVNYDFQILKAVEEVNEAQKLHLMPKINAYFNNNLAR